MTIGASLLLIALGAILKFAVTASVGGVDLPTVGVVLMVVGVVGLLLGVALTTRRRRTDIVQTDTAPRGPVQRRTTYVEPGAPVDPTDPRY